MGMAKHMVPDTGQMGQTGVYLSHTLTAQGGGHGVPCRAAQAIQNRGNKQDLVGDRLCSNKRARCNPVPVGGCSWLVD